MRRLAAPQVRIVETPEPSQVVEGAWFLPTPLEYRKTVSDSIAAMVEMTTQAGALRISIARGLIMEFGASGESSNPIPPDRVRSEGLDYLALGDWHGHLVVGDRTA